MKNNHPVVLCKSMHQKGIQMKIENWSEESKIFLRDYFLEAGKHLNDEMISDPFFDKGHEYLMNALIDYCDNCHSLKEKTISEKIMYLLSEGKLRISRSTGQTRLDKRMSGYLSQTKRTPYYYSFQICPAKTQKLIFEFVESVTLSLKGISESLRF